MKADAQGILDPYRRTLFNLLWQAATLGLVPGAILGAVALRPSPEPTLAQSPLWETEGHGENCPICAHAVTEADDPLETPDWVDPVVSARGSLDDEPAAMSPTSNVPVRDAG